MLTKLYKNSHLTTDVQWLRQFPYALKALPSTIRTKWDEESFQEYRGAFPAEYRSSPQGFEKHVRDLMLQDLKVPYLKSLQGYLWRNGYESGDLRCPLFPDVAPTLLAWHQNSIHIIIYSSGSVPAQKLLFQYTNNISAADLRPLILDYFDTVNAGPKTESSSYEKIVATHHLRPISNWLFLSDNVKEVDAAHEAGMQASLVDRPGNAPLSSEDKARVHVITSFEQVRPANMNFHDSYTP